MLDHCFNVTLLWVTTELRSPLQVPACRPPHSPSVIGLWTGRVATGREVYHMIRSAPPGMHGCLAFRPLFQAHLRHMEYVVGAGARRFPHSGYCLEYHYSTGVCLPVTHVARSTRRVLDFLLLTCSACWEGTCCMVTKRKSIVWCMCVG